jgi:hypothetical protein
MYVLKKKTNPDFVTTRREKNKTKQIEVLGEVGGKGRAY